MEAEKATEEKAEEEAEEEAEKAAEACLIAAVGIVAATAAIKLLRKTGKAVKSLLLD